MRASRPLRSKTMERAAFAPKALRRASPELARIDRERRREGFSRAMSNALEQAVSIAEAVRDGGGRALIVGGWVRDRLLYGSTHEPANVDLEVFGLPGDRLRSMLETFGKVEAVGESFQVYKI